MTSDIARSPITADAGAPQAKAAILLAVLMAAVVGTALLFQYVGGYVPCALCLEQRAPYYLGVPLMIVAAVSAFRRWPPLLTRGLLLLGGLLMLYGLGLAVYHAGVEWQFWPGPESCATSADAVPESAGALLSQLNSTRPPACDQAAGRFLGLSFAGWNALASAILAAIAFRAAFKRTRKIA